MFFFHFWCFFSSDGLIASYTLYTPLWFLVHPSLSLHRSHLADDCIGSADRILGRKSTWKMDPCPEFPWSGHNVGYPLYHVGVSHLTGFFFVFGYNVGVTVTYDVPENSLMVHDFFDGMKKRISSNHRAFWFGTSRCEWSVCTHIEPQKKTVEIIIALPFRGDKTEPLQSILPSPPTKSAEIDERRPPLAALVIRRWGWAPWMSHLAPPPRKKSSWQCLPILDAKNKD